VEPCDRGNCETSDGQNDIDITGPISTPSIEGYRYALIIIETKTPNDTEDLNDDAGTGYTISLRLQKKSDWILAFNKLISFTGPPRCLHSDNAKEFTSTLARQYLDNKNIKYTTTTPCRGRKEQDAPLAERRTGRRLSVPAGCALQALQGRSRARRVEERGGPRPSASRDTRQTL
jgi:hypothetical protein